MDATGYADDDNGNHGETGEGASKGTKGISEEQNDEKSKKRHEVYYKDHGKISKTVTIVYGDENTKFDNTKSINLADASITFLPLVLGLK